MEVERGRFRLVEVFGQDSGCWKLCNGCSPLNNLLQGLDSGGRQKVSPRDSLVRRIFHEVNLVKQVFRVIGTSRKSYLMCPPCVCSSQGGRWQDRLVFGLGSV